MPLDYYKELTPVFYNTDGLKILYAACDTPGILCFGMHWHERMELNLITSGSLRLRIGNSETILSAGHLAIIPPKQLHYGISGTEGVSYYTIMFDLQNFSCSLPAVKNLLIPLTEKQTTLSPWTGQPEIIALLTSLIKLHDSDEPYNNLITVGKIYELIALLYRHCLVHKELKTVTNENFHDVLDYIHLHFTEDISSDMLSKKFGYSLGYFSRHFKEVTGLSPMIYIRILRLEKAGKMLREQNLMFSEIATQCGFSDLSYFTKCFKSHFRLTPTEYARQ